MTTFLNLFAGRRRFFHRMWKASSIFNGNLNHPGLKPNSHWSWLRRILGSPRHALCRFVRIPERLIFTSKPRVASINWSSKSFVAMPSRKVHHEDICAKTPWTALTVRIPATTWDRVALFFIGNKHGTPTLMFA